MFLCYRLPAEDKTLLPEQAWDGEAGRTGWYLYDLQTNVITEDVAAIAEIIRSTPETPRRLRIEQPTLREIRLAVEKHIKKYIPRQSGTPCRGETNVEVLTGVKLMLCSQSKELPPI